MEFEYIKERYNVPAAMYREVIVDGKKGVITKDMGSYIGVNFYDNVTYYASPCHPTWRVEYLDSFNYKPPVMRSLLLKYQEEWKEAKANSKRTTKGGYEKVDLKEWGKMEAFAMIMDDLARLQ